MPFSIEIALLGWIPCTLVLFVLFPPQRAVAIGVIGGWLLLPPAYLGIPGFPDYDKTTAITLGIMLATLIFHPHRLIEFRFRWFDLITTCWCLCPLIASVQNGLGVYDGLSASLSSIIRWGFPYLIGRLYLGTLADLREFTIGIALGGLIYSLPTLFEIRMSPMLRHYVYGIGGGGLAMRFGGYRPFVFLSNGLEHGMWMTIASLSTVWLWRSGSLRRVGLLPLGVLIVPLLLVTLLCRSSGALFLLVIGLLILWISTRTQSKVLMYILLLVAPAYYATRLSGFWSGDTLVEFLDANFDQERADSLSFRFRCENLLMAKALQQPIWGWAGWGRSRVAGDDGRDLAPTDGMWIIYLGHYGLVGLFLWTSSFLVPPLRFLKLYPISRWNDFSVGPAAATAVLLGIYQIDTLLNGFLILPLITAAGGLICISGQGHGRNHTPGVPAEIGLGNLSEPELLVAREPICIEDNRKLLHLQLVKRYLDLAKSLRDRDLTSELTAAVSHAVDLLASVPIDREDSSALQDQLRWDYTNDLAWLLLTSKGISPEHTRIAVQLALRATEAYPRCGTYWNTLGAAFFQVGDIENCIDAIEHSMAFGDGGTAFDYLYLALSHAKLGHAALARNWYSRAQCSIQQSEYRSPDLIELEMDADSQIQACRLVYHSE